MERGHLQPNSSPLLQTAIPGWPWQWSPYLTLFWCGSCAPSPTRAMTVTYPAMPLVLPPSRVAGLTGNIPKLILIWVVVYFSGHWGGWWAGLGGVSWGHAACRDVHTPVSAQTLGLGGGTLGMVTGDLFPSSQHKTRLWIKRRL